MLPFTVCDTLTGAFLSQPTRFTTSGEEDLRFRQKSFSQPAKLRPPVLINRRQVIIVRNKQRQLVGVVLLRFNWRKTEDHLTVYLARKWLNWKRGSEGGKGWEKNDPWELSGWRGHCFRTAGDPGAKSCNILGCPCVFMSVLNHNSSFKSRPRQNKRCPGDVQ